MIVRVFSSRRAARLATVAAIVTLAAGHVRAGFTTFSVVGLTLPSSVQPTVDSFRAAIGGANNGNAAGPLAGGRREINWDGGGATTAAVTVGSTLSAFTNTRGATFTTPGINFMQTPLNVTELTSIQASYETTFATFSPVRIFTPTGSNVTSITFSLPGSAGATPATVSAFGAVFSDVELANTTKIELFDLSNALLQLFYVPERDPTAPDGTLSFLGVVANAGERIASIKITTGNQPLGAADSNGNPVDVVVMDDFLYAEPVAVPEPGTCWLITSGIAAAGSWLRRRR